jgi:PAS domain S-box-containing protein
LFSIIAVTRNAQFALLRDRMSAWLITFGSYVAAGYLSALWLSRVSTHIAGSLSAELAIPWIAPGLGVVLLYRYGRGMWPAITAGSIVIWGFIWGEYLPTTIAQSLGEALSIVLIVTLLRRWGFHPTLDRYKDSLLLLGVLAVGRAVSSAIDVLADVVGAWFVTSPDMIAGFAAAGVARHGNKLVINAELLRFSARWWANTVTGSLLVVPLLALRSDTAPARRTGYYAELMLLTAGVALWITTGLVLPPAGVWLGLLLPAALSLVAWAAIRFGVGIAVATVLVVALDASYGFGLQIGTFAGQNSRQSLEAAWGFIGLLVATSLFLTALLSQRSRTLRIIAASAERYRRLFVGSPYPMWTENPLSGQILLANPAALRTYGYSEDAFLARNGRDLAVDAHPSASAESDRAVVSIEQHRTRSGAEIDVEISRLTTGFDAGAVRISCVELLTERNQLRLSVLRAADIERFRLGDIIESQLMPLLAGLSRAAGQFGHALELGDSELALLAAINADAQAAGQICTRLTRGASPLQWAHGDLAEALVRLPATLPKHGPQLRVNIRPGAELSLSVERRDHVYRLAEEVVQSAASRAGAKHIQVTLDVSPENVRLTIEDDGAAVSDDPAADMSLQSITARAVAAKGQLEVGRSWDGGRLFSFECAQEQGTASNPARSASAPSAEPRRPAESVPDAADASSPGRRWWLSAALVALGLAIAGPMEKYMATADPSNDWYRSVLPLPWIPMGLAVAALLVGGERVWLLLFTVVLSLDLWVAPGGWPLQVVDAASGTLAAVATVRLLRVMRFRFACDRFRDLVALGAAAALGQVGYVVLLPLGILLVGVAMPGALTPELSAIVGGFNAPYGAFHVLAQGMIRWWVAGVTGTMLAVPAVVSWSLPALRRVRERIFELFCWTLALLAMLMCSFTYSEADWRLPILAGCIAVASWGAVRFGPAVAWAATLFVALSASASFTLHLGALAANRIDEGIIALWEFVVLVAAAAAVLTTLLAESENTERRLQQLNQRYRTLFDAVPHPLFALSKTSGQIRLANNKARECYGYSASEFEAMSLMSLEVDDAGADRMPEFGEPSTTTRRHLKKSGEILDVEVALTPIELDDGPGALCFSINVTERNRLRTQMIELADRERRRLALAVHDGLGQILTGLLLGIQPLLRSAEKHRPIDAAAIDFVSGAAREALAACARILRGISPLQETGGDLPAALRRLPDHLPPGTRDQLTVSVTATSAVTLPVELREHLYQIAREATNNSIKHANASRISVTLSVSPTEIELIVEDDGTGFEPTGRNAGLGLDSLRLRAAALNGRLRIARTGARGMIVRCRCTQPPPTRAAADAALTT